MADHVDPATRSRIMSAVHSKDTMPEVRVRKMLHSMGYRYRLHVAKLPGKPDIVFPSRHKIVFVHGCFWHRHRSCRYATTPKTRPEYWEEKFSANVTRDRATVRKLKQMGWTIATVWQCQLKNPERLAERLHEFLEG
jgi:DNA mismatch endonuclease (patch repair protein)